MKFGGATDCSEAGSYFFANQTFLYHSTLGVRAFQDLHEESLRRSSWTRPARGCQLLPVWSTLLTKMAKLTTLLTKRQRLTTLLKKTAKVDSAGTLGRFTIFNWKVAALVSVGFLSGKLSSSFLSLSSL